MAVALGLDRKFLDDVANEVRKARFALQTDGRTDSALLGETDGAAEALLEQASDGDAWDNAVKMAAALLYIAVEGDAGMSA